MALAHLEVTPALIKYLLEKAIWLLEKPISEWYQQEVWTQFFHCFQHFRGNVSGGSLAVNLLLTCYGLYDSATTLG